MIRYQFSPFLFLTVLLMSCCCNGKKVQLQQLDEDSLTTESTDVVSADNILDSLPEYMLRYATYVNDSSIISYTDRYTMVYIDRDNTPEMVIDSGCNAGGYIVLSLQGDKVLSYTTCRLALTYIEKSGLMRNESGAQEEYFATIIKLTKSEFEEIAHWEYSYSRDEQYRIIRSILNGKPTKVKDVERYLNKLYNDRKAIDIDSLNDWNSLSDLQKVAKSLNIKMAR